MNKVVKNAFLIIVAILIFILLLVFGSSKNNTLFYLESKYYNSGNKIKMDSNEIDKISNESFILFTYNSVCGMSRPCEEVFDNVFKELKIDYISIPFDEFKKTKYYDTVKYAPSIIIIKDGEIFAYLDANEDSHLDYYQKESSFKSWLSGRIYFEAIENSCVK